MADSINDDVRDDLLDYLTDLVGVEGEAAAFALSVIEFLRFDIEKQLLYYGDTLPRRSVEKAIRELDDLADAAFEKINEGIISRTIDVAKTTQGQTYKILERNIEISLGKPIYTAADIKRIASDLVIQGAPMQQLLEQQKQSTKLKVGQAIRQGMAANENVPQIVERIIGKKTGVKRIINVGGRKRVIAERAGGALATTRNHADALARTALLTVNNRVLMDIYEDNEDVIKGVACLVTLDLRTSPICQPRQGWAWNLKTSKPIKTYNTAPFDYQGPSPFHIRCRTVMVPVLKSFEELGGLPGFKNFDPGKRASMDGQVPNGISYEEWLRDREKRIPGTAARLFGNGAKLKAWQGGATVNDFINDLGVPLSAAELRERYGF